MVEVGGPGTLEKSLRAGRIGGTISLIGVLAGLEAVVNPLPVLFKAVRLQGISVGPRDGFEEMNRAIRSMDFAQLLTGSFRLTRLGRPCTTWKVGNILGRS